jgi:propionyl-CoA carboxylase alpha chain
VHRADATVYVDSLGASSTLVEVDRLPTPERVLAEGSMLAPMPGAVISVGVAVGERVTAGQTLAVIEAMKMEHAVHSAHDGVVTSVLVAPGQQVETAAVLVVVEPDGADGD